MKTIKSIVRNAVDLAYKVHGALSSNEEPVMILHGLLGSKKNWESMSKKISAATEKTVIAVDARNHGESPHARSHTYPDLAADVVRLLTQLSVNKPSLSATAWEAGLAWF